MGAWSISTPSGTIDLASYSVDVADWVGADDVPLRPVVAGDVYQGQATTPRTVVLTLESRARAAALPGLRAELTSALAAARGAPVQLRYAGSVRTLELDCVWTPQAGDLHGATLRLRFTAYDDPYWRDVVAVEQALATQRTLANAGRVVERTAAGDWTATNGPTESVICLAYGPDGKLYAGLGASPGVRVWDGTTWAALGSGVNGAVNALCWDGATLYVGGSFSTAGGAPAANVAYYDAGGWHAMGSGVSGGTVRALARYVDRSTSVILVGGTFTGYHKIWRAGVGWVFAPAVDGGIDCYLPYQGGYLMGGAFTTVQGVAVSYLVYVTGFWTVTALPLAGGTALTGAVVTMGQRADGTVFVHDGTYQYVWNGIQVRQVSIVSEDTVRLRGVVAGREWYFTSSGLSFWEGAAAHTLDLDVTATNEWMVDAAVARDGRIALALTAVSGIGSSGVTAIVVAGTAPTPTVITLMPTGARWEPWYVYHRASGMGVWFDTRAVIYGPLVLDSAARVLDDPLGFTTVGNLLADSRFVDLSPGANILEVARGFPAGAVSATLSYSPRFLSVESADG